MNKRKKLDKKWVVTLLISAALQVIGSSAVATADPGSQAQIFITPKGLKVKTLSDHTMDFIHAELLIFHKGKFNNPAIPSLTLLNIFDRNINSSGSDVLEILEKLGNDFTLEQTADYLVLKVNFLPDKFQQFARFLKGLYSYNPLANIKINPESYTYRKRENDTLQKFEKSVANYWRYFFKKENWKREMAYQIAYNKMFPGCSLGNTLITAETLKQAYLPDVRTFYQRVFRLPNSLLIVKGNIDFQLVRAYLNSEFSFFKEQVPEIPVEEILNITDKREIIVFNVNNGEAPVMFWFEAVDPLDNDHHIPILVVNNILFGFPFGRIYFAAREMDMGSLDIRSEVTNQKNVSVICNTIELRFKDIENFIQLADRERKKLMIKKVERSEFLNTLSYFHGKVKTDTQYFDNDVNHEILAASFPILKENSTNLISSSFQSGQFTLAGLNEHIITTRNGNTNVGDVIVIIGNYEAMSRYFKSIKPIVYNN
ncbi:MAG: insulinase family protein [Acidobacteria bacterium]|jgi:predicted Zn-dependent peptidase|nr:insulinase family protein [Acidobacteriota bacterium]